ncbi:hypothetical protein FSP39_014200 [Pinctada imbricata]|uniref:Fe2OG dioxygenase domain-containing protein n=1 Tax=Pinctada imbricata TaxID=66713 RepID=A0AA88YDN2_PINIB|nr:hypothetical protein FSP39_014200 [Pinctada imbricata]
MADGQERFAPRSEEDISRVRTELHSKNTIRSNKKAATILRAYLIEKSQNSNFEEFDTVQLNEVLSHFYMDLRKANGEKYKVTSLENIRHSLNMYLQSPPFNRTFDLIKGLEFSESNINFRAVLAELKREGKGAIDHHAVIKDADLQKLYSSVFLSPKTPSGLFNKIFDMFDVSKKFYEMPEQVKKVYAKQGATSIHGWIAREIEKSDPASPVADLKEAFNFQILDDESDIDYFRECHHLIGQKGNNSSLRSLYYPPLSSGVKSGQMRCGEHSDFGTITLLFQDDAGGLQVKLPNGDYIPADPIPDTVLVNLGDLMQRWTADKLVATKHRVVFPEDLKSTKGRQSFAFFVQADDEVVIECLDKSNKYEPMTSLDYLNMKFNTIY